MKIDINNTVARLERQLERLREDTELIAANRSLILEFDAYAASIGIGESRRCKYLGLLQWLSRSLGRPFRDATREDIARIVGEVEASGYAEWTKADRKIVMKRFYKWLKGNDESFPPEVKWIRCRMKNRLVKMPEDLITEEEVRKMADASRKPRDKAFVQVLYESGCRIAEVMTLQIKNVAFDDYGAVLRVTGKTGERRIRIVASAPALALWIDYHPYKTEPEAYVWARNLHKGAPDMLPFSYMVAKNLLTELADAAGVRKKVNPHAFRHARATVLANKLTEAQLKEHFGWVQGSDMASVYVHLSGRDVDNAILGVYGLNQDQKKEADRFRPQLCPRCSTTGSPGSKMCNRCGHAFSADVATQKEEDGGHEGICPRCRETCAPSAKFCSKCGFSLKGAGDSGVKSTESSELLELLMKDPRFQEMILSKLSERQNCSPGASHH